MSEDDRPAGRAVMRVAAELVVVFVGVSAAFVVDGYRERLSQAEELRLVTDAIIQELSLYEEANRRIADSIDVRFDAWEAATDSGLRAIPDFFRTKGAPRPPAAAWEAAVSSGSASRFHPALRFELGYFYSEFLGVHENYARRLSFIESEVLPRAQLGVDAFYGFGGDLLPEVRVEMTLLREFGADLRDLAVVASDLRERLQSLSP